VRQYEKPSPQVRRSDSCRREHIPFRIIPDRGQRTEDFSEGAAKEPWHIFQEDEAGSNFANHSEDVGPYPAFVGCASPLACDGEGLAGWPGRDNIHFAAPRLAVEGGNVIPDRSRIQGFVRHARNKDCG
jgi:hypothetical protein